jgi:N-acetylneuraminate synthase/N,N'-diacetyllegionaminate synthase
MREIGEGEPTFVIAEAGINHNGSLETAKELVRAASSCGADAVKFQLWNADTFHSESDQIERLRELEFDDDQWWELIAVADEEGIPFFASVFSEERLDFLVDDLDAPAVKIASGDLTHVPLLEHAATKNRPVILSTGMGTIAEVERAVEALEPNEAPVHLLECVSSYPVDVAELNLSVIKTLSRSFDCSAGFSDHTTGTVAATAAVALGATIIEKHFTLDTEMEGPDHELSLDPESFGRMVNEIRAIESGLGDGRKRPRELEAEATVSMRRGLTAARAVDRGERLTGDDVKVSRPADGIEPHHYDLAVGSVVQRSLGTNDPIGWDDLLSRHD